MDTRSSSRSRAALAAILVAVGCGGDESTGPEYGDLQFSPASPVVLGLARQVDLQLDNVSNASIGPLVLGAGSLPLSIPPGYTCPGLEVTITPNQIQSIAGGGSIDVSVTFSFAGLNEEECPLKLYAVDFNAASDQEVLGSTQIRLDHQALE
jgi:hypothetical protein